MSLRCWIVAVSLLALVVACGRPGRGVAEAPATNVPPDQPAGQYLAISAVPRLLPAPDLPDAARLVRAAGAGASFESATWSDVDSDAGLAKLTAALGSAGDRVVLLGLKVLDTTVLSVPPDLAHRPFDSAETRARWHALIDRLAPSVPSNVRYLSIGNEVDVYLGAHPAAWEPYRRFYADAVAYAHQRLPGVRVGVTSTFDGARGAAASRVAELNQLSDVVILTYYPLGPRFVPRPPATASFDIARMLTIAGDRPLVLQEVGYPSATRLSSSERAQAEFLAAVLAAWRAAGARMPLLNWFALHDFTEAICDQFSVYYSRPHDPDFRAYLCSLGLRHVDGTPKAAWSTLLGRG